MNVTYHVMYTELGSVPASVTIPPTDFDTLKAVAKPTW